MKKRALLTAFAALVLAATSSCSLFQSIFGETTLTISNDSSYNIDLVEWNGTYFGDDSMYDSDLGYYVDGIASGSSSTRTESDDDLESGSDRISFWFAAGGSKMATSEYITLDDNETAEFVIQGSTAIVAGSVSLRMTLTKADGSVETRALELLPVEEESGIEARRAEAAK